MSTVLLKNGTSIPQLGLGTWYLGDSASTRDEEIAALRYGIEAGATLIDTAEMYGNGRSEDLVGEAISPYERDSSFLISKVLPSNASRERIEHSLDTSLRFLNTDYLDMYLYHWRGAVPLEETVEELERLRAKGKISSWGVSNFDCSDMSELLEVRGSQHCQVNEVLYHLGSRGIEVDLQPLHAAHRVTTIAYSPLAQAGRLQHNLITNKVIQTLATDHGVTPFQILLAWVLAHKDIVAIPRTGSLKHMKENIEAASICFSQTELDLLDSAFPRPRHPVPLDIQ